MKNEILSLIPAHNRYVEVFGGGATVLFAKEPANIEVYNDLNAQLVNFFRVLRDQDKFKELNRLCHLTPYSREEFYQCRKFEGQTDVEQAWEFFMVARMAFSGRHKSPSWTRSLNHTRRGMPLAVSSWLSAVDGLTETHARLSTVLIENRDFRLLIPDCDGEDTFMYLDPPYVHESRQGKDRYNFEMSDADHEELLDIVLSSKSKFLLSGYENKIYNRLLDNGWEKKEYNKVSMAAVNRKKVDLSRTECLFISPNCN